MQIASEIASVFSTAQRRLPDLYGTWIQVSIELGSRLPASGLMMSVQREGSFDLVLRCMEDEHATALDRLAFHYQKMLSEYWISALYETFRLLRYRKLFESEASHGDVFADVELVRMAIDKHEIAKDTLLDMPLQLRREPSRDTPSDVYVYDPNDLQKVHIPPLGIYQGSLAWHVIDLRTNGDRWVVRRDVSDRVLSLWGKMPA